MAKKKSHAATIFNVSPEDVARQCRLRLDYINQTFFIIPHNDGEAVRCCQILRAVQAPFLHVSRQSWGATLDKEWPKINFASLDKSQVKNIMILEIPGLADHPGALIAKEAELVELGFQLDIIDHHHYQWVDRYKTVSSLEQLCDLIGWEMNDDDIAIAVNDRSYIPGLKALGLGKEAIRKVRQFDLVSQGNNTNYIDRHIKLAREWIPKLREEKRGDLWILDHPDVKQTYVSQELSIDDPKGYIQMFEIKGHKLGYSGRAEIVDMLLRSDFTKWESQTGPLKNYGGGDGVNAKFWSIKTAENRKSIPRAMADEVLGMIQSAMESLTPMR